MRHSFFSTLVFCVLGVICFSETSHAQGTNLLSTTSQAAGASWTAAIWLTNNGSGVGVGTAVAPVAGNTYTTRSNAIMWGNNLNSSRVRTPLNNTGALVTFPGDSLTVTTNSEIRTKNITAPAALVPILNFPGVGGNPGLILDGGILNVGDDGVIILTGKVHVASQSYIAPGDNGGGGTIRTARGFNIVAGLSGSGNMVIFQTTTNTPQTISGPSNTFSGQWIVKAGRLLGATPNSLGTNSITVDPFYTLPSHFNANIVDINSNGVVEVNYDLNSAGVLMLTNGGRMRLHQNCSFARVEIEGAVLSPGTHYYNELITNYPSNFDPGGSGSLTVQPFGAPPIVGPQIGTQPLPQVLFAGGTARFNAVATGPAPLAFRWQKGGVPLSDAGNVSGSTNTTLIITNVSVTDVAGYSMVVSNAGGSVTSSVVALSLVSPSGELYEAAVLAANPVAFYQLNETGDPSTNAHAFDFVGGHVGSYGTAVQNGFSSIAGPTTADGFPGFSAGNRAASFFTGNATARITAMPWNLNTNTVTLTAWINPTGAQSPRGGLVFCRGGGTVAGLNYSSSTDANGNYTLSYTWNNEVETYTWNSGLVAPPGQWSFVALVVTPTQATIHVMNTNGLVSSSRSYDHVTQAFGGTTLIGDDNGDGNGTRVFNGQIDDVAVFNAALSASQLAGFYSAASGVVSFAPVIGVQPAAQSLYAGQTAQFTVGAGGTQPLSYRWQAGATGGGTFTNLADGGKTSGAASATLTINNVAAANAADYQVVITNSAGSVTSIVATLTVQPTSPAENVTMSIQQAVGFDWDNATAPNNWSDSLTASESAASKPGSSYELLAGSRMRTPENRNNATFPGNILTVQGNGVWISNPGAGTAMAEVRFKQPVPGTVIFKKLVMNGGQLHTGNDGVVVVGGELNIVSNTPFYNETANGRGFQVNAWLTGSGSIEYRGYNQAAFNPNYTNNLMIAGTSNTFSGKWNVVMGTLLGTATNCLGTNDITVGVNGALETTYDLRNTNGNLFLNGRILLHQDDVFRSVFVNGVPLAPGTYSFAQLSSTYSNNFPASWTPQYGAAGFSSGSGSITVLVQPAPVIAQDPAAISRYPTETAQLSVIAQGNPPLFYQWRKGGVNLSDAGNISGTATTNLTITNLVAGNGGNYDVVITNSIGSVTSKVAVLTILPTGPAETITMSMQQAAGNNWDTAADWSDGLAASISALSKPGSTYQLLPGARLRSPEPAANATFPGQVLTLEGDGVWNVNPGAGATISEIRFKQGNPGRVNFPRLVMNGGQLDSGNDGIITVGGRIDVLTNAPINNDNANDRGYVIDAWLTGTGTIEFHGYNQAAFMPAYVNNLNIAGTSNTFSGAWNVVMGVLLGSAPNSLGTNNITVGVNGALETLYNINNPQGELILDGLIFLHQNNTFRRVTVAGTSLAPGTYTFAQLNSVYPANFPATWTQQTGSSFNSGSGSITVGAAPPPPVLQFEFSGSNLKLTWSQGTLLEADNVNGPWSTNAAASPLNVTPTAARKFYRTQVP